jgi:hypothetical protein
MAPCPGLDPVLARSRPPGGGGPRNAPQGRGPSGTRPRTRGNPSMHPPGGRVLPGHGTRAGLGRSRTNHRHTRRAATATPTRGRRSPG